MKKVSSNSKRVSKSYNFFFKKNRIKNVSIHMKKVSNGIKKVSKTYQVI
jgi:hypothetical protein